MQGQGLHLPSTLPLGLMASTTTMRTQLLACCPAQEGVMVLEQGLQAPLVPSSSLLAAGGTALVQGAWAL